jgi:hypothetical protein
MKTIISTPPSQRARRLSKACWLRSVRPTPSSEMAAVMIAAAVRVALRLKLSKVSRKV